MSRLRRDVFFIVPQDVHRIDRIEVWNERGRYLHLDDLPTHPGDEWPLPVPPNGQLRVCCGGLAAVYTNPQPRN